MFNIIKTLDSEIVSELLSIAKKAELKPDVSSYAKGRQRTFINMNWDFRDRKFNRDCFVNDRMWNILKDIWPESEIGLLTYSGEENPKGIDLHRDDSYADYESWGVQLSGTCEFHYMGGYKNFKWEQDREEEKDQIFIIKPGDVFRFNCKNKHSAIPSVDRYAINLWKISDKFRRDFDNALTTKITTLF